MLLFCVSVVCASLSTHLSATPVLYLSVILNSKPDRCQAAIGTSFCQCFTAGTSDNPCTLL